MEPMEEHMHIIRIQANVETCHHPITTIANWSRIVPAAATLWGSTVLGTRVLERHARRQTVERRPMQI